MSIRAAFVNSGLLGHGAFASLMPAIVSRMHGVDAVHVDLRDRLSLGDRLIRRALSVRLTPPTAMLDNVDVRRWRQEFNAGWLAARRLAALERGTPFGLLHFHTQATAYASLRRMRRTPSIVSIDSTQHLARLEAASSIGRASYAPNVRHDGAVFRAAAAIVATSEWAARDLRAHYPGCDEKVRVLPFPVDVDVFGDDWAAYRRARGSSADYRPRVLFIGGDFVRKGGEELLAAWREGGFAARATLDLVTDWPIAAGSVPAGVDVIPGIRPYSPPWIDLWRRADLFVAPTRHDAFGIVFEEAAAASLPVVATGINAIPEIVDDGRTGVLVRPGDGAALAAAMRGLIDSPALRQRMGDAAREHVSARASVPTYAAALEAIIHRAVTHDAGQPV
jgi:glycosyltransferase involved in cell wall biosynthesis